MVRKTSCILLTAMSHHLAKEVQHGFAHGSVAQQVGATQSPVAEPPDGKGRIVDGDRRDRRVHATPIGQSEVGHGCGLVDPSTDPRGDALDDPNEVLAVAEAHLGPLETAEPLHEDVRRAVHQDVGNGRVEDERGERAQPEGLLHQVPAQAFPLALVERQVFVLEHGFGELANERDDLLLAGTQEVLLGQFVQQP